MISKAYRNKISGERGVSIGILLVGMILFLFLGTAANAQERYFSENAWSFGVMADTQWTVTDPDTYEVLDPEGLNPETVSGALAQALQNELIEHGVRFVVQVGDLSDQAGDAAMAARAEVGQPLLDAGIGLFPLRGNHETYGDLFGRDPELDMDVPAFRTAFPQTQGLGNTFGATNFSGPDIPELKGLSYSFDYGDENNNARFVIVDVEQTHYWLKEPEPHPVYGTGYDYPAIAGWEMWVVYKHTADLFDKYNNVVPAGSWFRIDSSGKPSTNFYDYEKNYWPLDDFTQPVKPKMVSDDSEFWPGDQQDWISAQLNKATRGTEHAFVFSHRGLMGANHVDGFFGSNPGSKSSDQNDFYASLEENGVRYMLSGHDHLHNRALVKSPDGQHQVEQIIHMAGSTKFYTAAPLNDFITYYGDVKQREAIVSQEFKNVGYYIYTVDGPRVSVEYYADANGGFQDGYDYPYGDDSPNGRQFRPPLNFVKKETYGYGINGQRFLVPQGTSYSVVQDSYKNTMAKILDGINSSTTIDGTPTVYEDQNDPETKDNPDDDTLVSAPRALTKLVTTGWQDRNRRERLVFSDIFSIWGMSELGQEPKTDEYVIAMQVDMDAKEFNRAFPEALLRQGKIGIAALNSEGEWVNAVTLNVDSYPRIRPYMEPYDPARHKLGDWGIIPNVPSSRYSKKDIGTVWAVVNYNADFAVAQFGQKAACFNCYKKK